MLVVAVTPLYPPRSRVGAWLATHEFLAGLAARGHTVKVCPLAGHSGYNLDGVDVLPRGATPPAAHVYLSHSGDNGDLHRRALAEGVPSVRMVHGQARDHVLDGASLVVFNSEANAKAHQWDGPQVVCPPPTFPDRYRTTPGDRVTLVNLSKQKGGTLLYLLAQSEPNRRFLGIKGGYGHQFIRQTPNLDVMSTVSDMRDVFSRTRVLLVPSERETWGMVAVEAMCSGIPVIAHPTDGLRESLGDAGIYADRDDLAEWKEALHRLDHPAVYADASRRALARVTELDPADSVDRFVTAVEALV